MPQPSSSLTGHPTETSGQGGTLYEWITPPGADNHWGDVRRMAAIAASISGVAVSGESKTRTTASKPQAEQPRKCTLAERHEAKRRAG